MDIRFEDRGGESVTKYECGDQITSISELVAQDFVMFAGKVYHHGWFMSWPLRAAQRYLTSGWLFRVVPIFQTVTQADIEDI